MSRALAPKVWFITGCSSGFGSSLAKEALSRGDKVIASARNITKIEHLKDYGANIVQMDVTEPLDELKGIAQQAYNVHNRIDYLVNNAGYFHGGTVEETTMEESYAQYATNVFGLLNVTRAFLPYMRTARSGVIANISSIGAWAGYPNSALYCSSKWAVSGISESMTAELADLGIKVCCIEPGTFRSDFLNTSNFKMGTTERIKDYEGTPARGWEKGLYTAHGTQPGDIAKGAAVMVDVLSGKDGKDVPMRLALGGDGYSIIKQKCEDTLKLLEEWKDISCSTDHDDVQKQ